MFSFRNLSAKVRIAAAAGAMLLATGVAAAPAAYASTASGAAPAAVQTAAIHSQGSGEHVATQCGIVVHRFSVYGSGCSHRKGYLCFVGNHENFRGFPKFASNGCETDVKMYPTRGTPLCVRFRSATGDLHANYVSFRVLSTRGC